MRSDSYNTKQNISEFKHLPAGRCFFRPFETGGRFESDDLKLVARALLPPEIVEGSRLKYEMKTYYDLKLHDRDMIMLAGFGGGMQTAIPAVPYWQRFLSCR